MTDIKKLMGDDITAEAAEALQTILDESVGSLKQTIDEKTTEVTDLETQLRELQEEIADLKADHAKEIEYIQEKAEEYATQLRDEAVEEITEKAEEYGAFLMEKADDYGDFLQEKAEQYGEHLIEKADEYGDFLQEKAEQYGEHLIEKAEEYGDFLIESADEYGSSVEEKCLSEAKYAIDEFKDQHKAEFEKLDEHNRVMNVFNAIKTLVEESGFTFEDASLYDELKEERAKNRRLVRTLRENEEELKRGKILEFIAESNEDISFVAKEKIVKSALRTRCQSNEELADVVKTLVENNLLNSNNERNTSTKLDESTTSFGGKVSGWGGKLL